MILATKQGQNGLAQPDLKPYTNPTPGAKRGEPHCQKQGWRQNHCGLDS